MSDKKLKEIDGSERKTSSLDELKKSMANVEKISDNQRTDLSLEAENNNSKLEDSNLVLNQNDDQNQFVPNESNIQSQDAEIVETKKDILSKDENEEWGSEQTIHKEQYLLEIDEAKKLESKYKEYVKQLAKDYEVKTKEMAKDYEVKTKLLANDYEIKAKEMAKDYDNMIKQLASKHKDQEKSLANEYENQEKWLASNFEAKEKQLATEYENRINLLLSKNKDKEKQLANEYENKVKLLLAENEKQKQGLADDYEDKIKQLVSNHDNLVKDLVTEHEMQVKELASNHENQINQLISEHEVLKKQSIIDSDNRIKQLKFRQEEQIRQLVTEHEKKVKELESKKESESNKESESKKELESKNTYMYPPPNKDELVKSAVENNLPVRESRVYHPKELSHEDRADRTNRTDREDREDRESPFQKMNTYKKISTLLAVGLCIGLAITGGSLIALNAVNSNYNQLYEDYSLEQSLRIGNSLESYFDLLRDQQGPTYDWWESEATYWQECADFIAIMGLHSLGRIYYLALEANFYAQTGMNSHVMSFNKIKEVAGYIDCTNDDTDTEIVKAVLEFVSGIITYQTELNDVYHSPVETLAFKSGDCDDFAILAATFLEYFGIESAIGLFTNDYSQGHAMTLVNIYGLSDYGYYYYSDLTSYGLDSGRWVILEPQTTINYQYTSWIDQWSLVKAAELDVEDYV